VKILNSIDSEHRFLLRRHSRSHSVQWWTTPKPTNSTSYQEVSDLPKNFAETTSFQAKPLRQSGLSP
jgi:hypothetical protein